jgi:hypothetical protein
MKNNIVTGIGHSTASDSYKAAKEAATAAIKGLKGRKPTISFVFFAGDYDPKEINRAFSEVYKGTEFVGGSTDAVIHESKILTKGVVACSISSDYLHVGVASADNVTADPRGIGKKTMLQAVGKISVDKYIDSYIQFARMKKNDLASLMRIPSFYTFIFTRGYQPTRMGNEDLIIDGVPRPAQVGEEGLLLVNTIARDGTIFINYAIGDKARVIATSCPCGRTTPIIGEIRREDNPTELAGGCRYA